MEVVEGIINVPLRRRRNQEKDEWYMGMVSDYFIHRHSLKDVKERYNFSSTQTLYNARNYINKKFEEQRKEKKNV